jgi:hypothetical protein
MEEKQIELYRKQIEFCYGNVEWTQKIHEKAADIYNCVNNWFRWTQLVLSFLISADVLRQVNTDSPVISTVLVVCTIVLALINTITKTFDFSGRANKHVLAANSLWGLREDYRSFKNDIAAGVMTIEQIQFRRRELQEAVQEVYKTAPRTFDRAYKKAQEDFDKGKVTFDHLNEK